MSGAAQTEFSFIQMPAGSDLNAPPRELMTLDEILLRLAGKAGRSKVLQHLRAMRPPDTPRKKILLREADYQHLLESLSCRSHFSEDTGRGTTSSAGRSAESQYTKALKLLTAAPRKRSASNTRRGC
jgi:hypothetical protein